MGLPAGFCPWSGSGRALRSVLTYEVKRPEGHIGCRKDVMPVVQGNAIAADGSGQLGLLCFCPYWVVIGLLVPGFSGLVGKRIPLLKVRLRFWFLIR